MSYKDRLIKRVLEIDQSETKEHCIRVPIAILESWIIRYRRYNPDIDPKLFDMDTI